MVTPSAVDDFPEQIRDALARGELTGADLTARGLGAFAGKTSSVLYHRYGSLDAFLFRVTESGMQLLGAEMVSALERGASLPDLATLFVSFGLEKPALYRLMFEHRYDWQSLREAGAFNAQPPGLLLWGTLIGYLRGRGSQEPEMDARALYAGLHGLVSLALSGRANVGELTVSDREMAIRAACHLATKLEHVR